MKHIPFLEIAGFIISSFPFFNRDMKISVEPVSLYEENLGV